MPKLLIISPNFPPKNTADMHRVRTSIPYYRRFGWTPTVLCIDPRFCEGLDDPTLAASLPSDVEVIRIPAWREEWTRRVGFGHLSYRAILPLYRAARTLLARERHEVVLFSSTVFETFILGPILKRRFSCRVVYDFQDPWFQGGGALYTRATAPGGWWKYRVSQILAKYLERYAIQSADHVMVVSEGYVVTLTDRYPALDRARFTVIPFGAMAGDYEYLSANGIRSGLSKREDRVNWVSVGRGGVDMASILSAFFQQLALLKARDPEFAARVRARFVGTNYAPPDRSSKMIEPLAAREGVIELVEELPGRVPYFEALALYADSDAVLLFGSISSDYTASKLFSCVLARNPVLALFHKRSLVSKIAKHLPNVFLAQFDESPNEVEFQREVARGLDWLRTPTFDASAIDETLKPWSAEELTRVQCAIFDRIVGEPPSPPPQRAQYPQGATYGN